MSEKQQPARNVGDAGAVADGKREAKSERKRELEDLRWLMGQKPGRRFVWRLLGKAGIFRTSFTGNSTTFFNEGMRNLGLTVLNDINEDHPDLYQVMVTENRRLAPSAPAQQEDTRTDD